MAYQSFESLDVWKRASRLAVEIYKVLKECPDRSLKDQMTRAAVSVPSNIAEGYERGTNKEFIRYLNIAKGSAAELRTQLYIAQEIGLLKKSAVDPLVKETKELAAMLQALQNSRASLGAEEPPGYELPQS